MSTVQETTVLNKIRSRGYWRVVIRPTTFQEHRVPRYADLFPIIEKNSVQLRGWDYPHIDRSQPPQPATYYLFFLKSIAQEVKGDLDGALASLLTSDTLRPGFEAANLNLARLYHQLAEHSTDRAQKSSYACAARDRFARYISRAFRGRPAPPEIEQERTALEAECQAYSQPSKTEPAKAN